MRALRLRADARGGDGGVRKVLAPGVVQLEPKTKVEPTSILPSLNVKTARSRRAIVPSTHLAREGRMTVTIGRRELLAALGGAAAWPLAARAQQGEQMHRVGVLIAGLTEKDSEGQLRMAAFRAGLQNLGWIEGRNVHIEERWPGGNNERLRSLAAELVGMRPDAISTGNEAAMMALQHTASTLPIVFAQVSDPVAAGLVVSPARPGGNVTGFALWEYGFILASKVSGTFLPRHFGFRRCQKGVPKQYPDL